jgi:hypothetical protein
MMCQKRKDRMSSGTGDDFEQASFLEFAENRDEIVMAAKIKIANAFETIEIKSCQRVKRFFPMCAVLLSLRQFDESMQVPQIPFLEQWVQEHGTKRRGEGEGQADSHCVLAPLFEELQEWNVSFGYGFEEPILFEKLFVLRMANKRQMSVKDKSEVAFH